MKQRVPIIVVLASLTLLNAAAVAQPAPAPASFVYNMTMGTGKGTSMDFTMAFTVTSTSEDGTRAANVVVKAPKIPPIDGKTVSATISPSGAIIIGSTGEMPKHFSPAQSKAASQAVMGPMVQMLVNPLSSFAAGCGSAPSQKTGASWHAFSNQAETDVLYTITGREQVGGRDTLVITMASASTAGAAVSGQGNYDPAAHLVVKLHSTLKQSADATQAQVLDAALAGP